MKKLIVISLWGLSFPTAHAGIMDVFQGRGHKIVLSFPDGKVLNLNKSTTCAPASLGGQNACYCCVLKHTYDKKEIDLSFASQALNYCVKKNYCSLAQFPSQQDRVQFIQNLKQKYIRTAEVDLSAAGATAAGETLNAQQPLTELTVPAFLKVAAQQDLVPEPEKSLFLENNCALKAVKLGSGGFQTGLLFGVSLAEGCKGPDAFGRKFQYIFKETKKKTQEMKNLVKLKENVQLQKLDFMHSNAASRKYLLMAFEVNHLLYGNQDKKYFTLSNTAPGVPFSKLLKDANSTLSLNDLYNVMYEIGEKMARFHRLFMNTQTLKSVAHKDLHIENIFIDRKLDMVTLIDLETMASTLTKPANFTIDLLVFSMFPLLEKTFSLPASLNTAQWTKGVQYLLAGYLSCFEDNPPLKMKIKSELQRAFLKNMALVFYQERGLVYNPLKITDLQNRYLKKVFQDLEKSETLSLTVRDN